MFELRVDDDITLRLHDMFNVEGFYALIDRNRDFVGQWLEWTANHKSVDDTYKYILWEREQFGKRKQFTTQIYYRGEIAGSISLMIRNWYAKFGEIGYWLGESFTGKGIVTRATEAMLNFGFNTLGLHKIIIQAIKENTPSIAVAERLNFKFEGYQIQQRLLRGTYYDYSVHYLLRNDWTGTQAPDFKKNISEEIELRPLMMHHTSDFLRLVDTHRITLRQWVDWVDRHRTIDDTVNYIEDALSHYGDYDGLDAGIWYQGQFCGQVRYNSWNLRNYKGDLGYWLAQSFTGKGIMTQSVKVMLDYAFEVVGLHRIELICAVENARSCKVAERLNFTHEGVIRRGERVRNRYFDAHAYALLRPDWKRQGN